MLKYAPGIGMSGDNMNYCLGNARFIRAYCYFWIARVWGEAPVITTPTEEPARRSILAPSGRRGLCPDRRRPERCGGVYQDQCEGLLLCDGRQRQSAPPTSRSGCMRRAAATAT
ncbi:MAG: hypothetical protein ACLRM8_06360 [Alistipes sp.]